MNYFLKVINTLDAAYRFFHSKKESSSASHRGLYDKKKTYKRRYERLSRVS